MKLEGKSHSFFLPTPLFSLHIFMHSLKVDSEFTSSLGLTLSISNFNLFMFICVVSGWEGEVIPYLHPMIFFFFSFYHSVVYMLINLGS